MARMKDLLLTWGSLAIAIAALVQPWVIALWKRFVRQQRIDIYESGTIEVGFSRFGPTIGLNGTLRAMYRDVFVSSIELCLVRRKDHLRHTFAWGVFRSPSFGAEKDTTFQICSGFMLQEKSPFAYNVQFWDRDTLDEMRPSIERIRKEWTTHVFDAIGGTEALDSPDVAAVQRSVDAAQRTLYPTFMNSPGHVQAFTELSRRFSGRQVNTNLRCGLTRRVRIGSTARHGHSI